MITYLGEEKIERPAGRLWITYPCDLPENVITYFGEEKIERPAGRLWITYPCDLPENVITCLGEEKTERLPGRPPAEYSGTMYMTALHHTHG